MLEEHNKLIAQAHRVLDVCITFFAFILAYFIKKNLLPFPFDGLITVPNYYIVVLMAIIIWYVVFNLFGLYDSFRKSTFGPIFYKTIKAGSTATLIMLSCMYLLKITDVSRIMMGIFFLLDIGLLILSKGVTFRVLTRYKKKGFNVRNILIVGSRQRAGDIIDTIEYHLDAGYRICGCLDLDPAGVGTEVKKGIHVIGELKDLKKILLERVVDELIFAMPMRKIERAYKYVAIAEEIGVSVKIVPDWQIFNLIRNQGASSVQLEEFLGIPTMAVVRNSPNQGELFIKNVFDYFFSILALFLSLPFFLLIPIAIKLSSRGPVCFKQERCGLNGRRFKVYKFRTMVAHAEGSQGELQMLNEADGPVFKMSKDPRVTPFVGTFLRRSGLDELPQLINIIKGEMSLIGPRPPLPKEVEKYELWQRRRLSMKPGLTCLWQTLPNRNEVSFKEWMKMDLRYIDNWSLGMDFKILIKTPLMMLTGAGM